MLLRPPIDSCITRGSIAAVIAEIEARERLINEVLAGLNLSLVRIFGHSLGRRPCEWPVAPKKERRTDSACVQLLQNWALSFSEQHLQTLTTPRLTYRIILSPPGGSNRTPDMSSSVNAMRPGASLVRAADCDIRCSNGLGCFVAPLYRAHRSRLPLTSPRGTMMVNCSSGGLPRRPFRRDQVRSLPDFHSYNVGAYSTVLTSCGSSRLSGQPIGCEGM